MLYAICIRYLKNTDDAQDLLQDSFITIFKKIGEFKFEGSFEGWLKKITVNQCLQFIRKNKNKFFTSLDENENQLNANPDLIDVEEDDPILSPAEMFSLLKELPDGYRTIFNLYVLDGFSHKEIGEQLNISEGTSKSQLARAKKVLREKINLTISQREGIYGKMV